MKRNELSMLNLSATDIYEVYRRAMGRIRRVRSRQQMSWASVLMPRRTAD